MFFSNTVCRFLKKMFILICYSNYFGTMNLEDYRGAILGLIVIKSQNFIKAYYVIMSDLQNIKTLKKII